MKEIVLKWATIYHWPKWCKIMCRCNSIDMKMDYYHNVFLKICNILVIFTSVVCKANLNFILLKKNLSLGFKWNVSLMDKKSSMFCSRQQKLVAKLWLCDRILLIHCQALCGLNWCWTTCSELWPSWLGGCMIETRYCISHYTWSLWRQEVPVFHVIQLHLQMESIT